MHCSIVHYYALLPTNGHDMSQINMFHEVSFEVTYPTNVCNIIFWGGGVAPHTFSIIRVQHVLWCCIWYLCPLSILTKISTFSHRVCGKSFLEWKKKFQNKTNGIRWIASPIPIFWTTTLHPERVMGILTQSQFATVYFFCTISSSFTVAVCDCVFHLSDLHARMLRLCAAPV